MNTTFTIPVDRLNARRQAIGMSYSIVSDRSGVSEPTVKRILGGQAAEASFSNVVAVAAALGITLELGITDADELCRAQARHKAEQAARLVQGTSALESQAVDPETYGRLVEKSYLQLLAGSKRRLWSV